MGNSIVAKQIESSNRNQYLAEQGAALTNKLSNSLNADLNERLEHSTAEVMVQTNLNFSMKEGANFASGVSFAERGMANLAGLKHDLALKQASVANVQNRIGLLEENSANFRLNDTRRLPTPYQGISDQELQNFLGVDTLAGDYISSAFDKAFGPRARYNYSGGAKEDYNAAKQFYTEISTGVGALNISSDSLFVALNSGWGATSNIGKKPNLMWLDPKLTSVLDYSFAAPVFDTIAKGAAFATPFVSALNGVNETILNPDGYDNVDVARESGKFLTDSLAAATALSKLARFSPLGVAYTAVDIGVQNFVPEYTIQYGTYAGDTADGWSGLMHRSTDFEMYKIQNGLNFDRPTK